MAEVVTTNLIQGQGWLYHAPFGTAEPADTAFATVPDDADWTEVGGTKDGVNLKVAEEWAAMEVDQIVDVPGRRRTKREFMIETNIAEGTLENLKLAMNGGTIAAAGTAATAHRTLTPDYADAATQPNYAALILDGYAPEGNVRRVVGRKMLSIEGTEFAYNKAEMTVLKVSFAGHYVSKTIAPFKVVDGEPTA